MTFAARIDFRISSSSGFVIAHVIPAPIAIAMNTALSVGRPANPKEMLEAPQIVFTPSSSRRRLTNLNRVTIAEGTALTILDTLEDCRGRRPSLNALGSRRLTVPTELRVAAVYHFCRGAGNIVFSRNASFGTGTGLLQQQSRLLARGVLVVDRQNVIRHIQIVPDQSQIPDMQEAARVARGLL